MKRYNTYKAGRRNRRRTRRVFRKRGGFRRRVRREIYKMSEYKTLGIESPTTTVTASGVAQNLIQIVQGTGKAQRVGNRIKLRYLRLRMSLFSNDASNIIWRVAVVRQRQGTGRLALGDFPLTSDVQPFDFDKMQLVWEQRYHTGNMNATDRGIITIDKTIWLGTHMNFDDNVSPIPNLPYILFVWTNDLVIPSPYMYWYAVVSYIDL